MNNLIGKLSRRHKQGLALLFDATVLPLALWTALGLRLGEWSLEIAWLWPAFAAALTCIPALAVQGFYRQVVRYMGGRGMWTVAKGVAIGAAMIAVVAYMVPLAGFPRSVPMMFWLIGVFGIVVGRLVIRGWFQWRDAGLQSSEPVIVYGAGKRGVELVRSLLRQGDFRPMAFVDDDAALQHRVIDNLRVHAPRSLPRLLRDTNARQVLVAVGGASNAAARRRILNFLEPFGVRIRLIPDIGDLMLDKGEGLPAVRDVEIRDLLGRSEVDPLPHLLRKSVAGRNVMVTGAGGSIGSELCRQIVRQRPARLVLLDQSEFGLFEIQRELEQICTEEQLGVSIVSLLGSVTNRAFIHRSIEVQGIETLYHAAAYKHVGIVEDNVIQGLRNNAFGTLYTAEGALAAGVSDFILISTDKAVRTTSAMGASKRLGEMILQALQETASDTCFSIVRFGNVLGSSGSVVPLFLEQIENGGPVTVTHADVTRYFMTIQEAAQLVLQAASLGRGGDVFLLDMGQPVKIMDLAARMALIRGHRLKTEFEPDGDIDVQFIGLRPGEKLHEELLVGEDVTGTEHPRIMRAEEGFVPWRELRVALKTLEQACDSYDFEAIKAFTSGLIEGSDLESQLGGLVPKTPVLRLS